MKTKILTTLTFCVLSNAYSAPQLFRDITTHNLLKIEKNILQEGNDLIRDTNSKVDETNSVLGRAGDNNVLQMHGKGVSDLLFRTHSMNSNVLSSFERVNN
ncbi:MAG: hypothetical protein HRT69_18815, partial [Flavobacteriaceae bacterium]|nr:hypothetical protein [Flavobacteriaceae bacterium]